MGIIPFGAGLTGVSYLMWDLKPSSLIESAEPSLQPPEKDSECLIRLEIVYKWEFGLKCKIEAYFLKEKQNGQED